MHDCDLRDGSKAKGVYYTAAIASSFFFNSIIVLLMAIEYMQVERMLYIHMQGHSRVHTLDFARGHCKLNSDPDIWPSSTSGWAKNSETDYSLGRREFTSSFHYAGDEAYMVRTCQFRPYPWLMGMFPGRDAYLGKF